MPQNLNDSLAKITKGAGIVLCLSSRQVFSSERQDYRNQCGFRGRQVFLIPGVDAVTWTVMSPKRERLKNFYKRLDVSVNFVWDVLHKQGKRAKALNVPFVVPPYSFNVDFKSIGFGLPTDEKEWQEELSKVTEKTREIIDEGPDLLVSVYTLLDRVQHFHWGEDCVLEWYQKLDDKIGEFLFGNGFMEDKDNKLIVISDHGFCSFGEAKVQTLPEETEHGKLKGDHHENALLIFVNVEYEIDKPQDVFSAVLSATT